MSNQTKNCKYCQSEISKKAKICPVCKKKQKNSFLGIILIVIIFIAIVGAYGSQSTESEYNVTSSTTDTHNTRTEVTVKPAEAPKKLTIDKFNAIQFGMTYEEVLDIVGEEGTNISETTIMDYVTAIYQWDEGLNNFNVTFENNVVIGKAQFGLNSITGSNVTLEMYNSIKSGMTYDDVVAIFESEGSLLSTVTSISSG